MSNSRYLRFLSSEFLARVEKLQKVEMKKGVLVVSPARELAKDIRESGIPATATMMASAIKLIGGVKKTTTKDGKHYSGYFFEKDEYGHIVVKGGNDGAN